MITTKKIFVDNRTAIMETYKQDIKERTRELLWNHAVRSLTQSRMDSRVLNPLYLDNLWDFVKKNFDKSGCYDPSDLDDLRYEDWKRYGETVYGTKRPEELKVAFFCGPEPENDVNHLVRLGVRIENMYAFEYDKDCFKAAVDSLHFTYPNLKIFRGKISEFLSLNEVKFDIIYLDFTKSLIAEFRTVFQILESNVLSDLGILMINTTYPDKDKNNIDFLTQFYLYSYSFECSALHGYDDKHFEDDFDGRTVESCYAHGYDEELVREKVAANFECAYDVFQTRMVLLYSNLIKPVVASLNNKLIRERLFANKNIDRILDDEKLDSEFLQSRYEDDAIPISYMISCMGRVNDAWRQFFENEPNKNHSRMRCMRATERFIVAKYEDNEDVLSPELKVQLDEVDRNLIGGRMGLFCDVPMIHLWLELMLHQFGHSYHQNTAQHKRYCYQAKERKMCIDAFTFDKCRMLYDTLPLVEYLGSETGNPTSQMIVRMAMDAIDKHSLRILDDLYFGSALIGIGDEKWSYNKMLPNRIELK